MDNNNKSGNNFFSGFLLGVLIGAAAVFLLGTKEGKRLLKVISEKGLDNISNFPEEDQKITPKKEIAIKDLEKKPRVRRFFRGISRHLN